MEVTQLAVDKEYTAHDKIIYEFLDDVYLPKLIEEKNMNSQETYMCEGPPFVNSPLLHMGHALVTEIKSCITKYIHMKGNKCKLTTGLDTHGIPTKIMVSKLLNLQTPSDIVSYGVAEFNKVCKETILKYETCWDPIYKSLGRTVDLNSRYRTMDTNFMESIFWGFKTLWDKNLIYKSYKVVPYSYKMKVGLSNFEASQCYKEITDLTTYVFFPLVSDANTGFVAWTSMVHTLIANVALCVNPNGKYVKVTDKNNRSYIVHENYIQNLGISITSTEFVGFGKDLVGIKYTPPFNYFSDRTFQVIADEFVEETADIGSGIVHVNPMSGEIDYDICIKNNIITIDDISKLDYVNDDGTFADIIPDYKNILVFDAVQEIIDRLEGNNILVKKQKYTHSYPHSDRTGERLIYKAMSNYFVNVTAIKDKLLENNEKINWVPKHVGVGRFKQWLMNAKDWCISRNNIFFGTPIPVWISDDEVESICIGSIDELVALAKLNNRPADLHSEFLDEIKIISPITGKVLHRVSFLLDCWFESGSVPYAQIHYPFENSHEFDDKEYLSDFVCESIDQCRGWYYTCLVLSTALFNKPSFKNIICSGLVLDKEGKKISKRHGNFKDPREIIEQYSSDAVRMYLLGSPAVQADNVKFDEDNIKKIVKPKLIQWQNGIRFFIEHYLAFTKFNNVLDKNLYKSTDNIFDQWILMRINNLIQTMDENLSKFLVNQNVQPIYNFIEDFTNWYLKLNRNRIKGICGNDEWNMSLSVTSHVILNAIKCMVPYMPFLSEHIYQHIKILDCQPEVSIHLCKYPVGEQFNFGENLMDNITIFQSILSNIRALRSKKAETASIRKPIKRLYIAHDNQRFLDFVEKSKEVLCEEINCIDISISKTEQYLRFKLKPNMKELAKKYKQHMKNMKEILETVSQEQMKQFHKIFHNKIEDAISINYNGNILTLTRNEIEVTSELNTNFGQNICSIMIDNLILAIDTDSDQQTLNKYLLRQFIMAVQNLRKESDIHPWDVIVVGFKSAKMNELIDMNQIECQTKLKCQIVDFNGMSENSLMMKEFEMRDLMDNVCDNIIIKIVKE